MVYSLAPRTREWGDRVNEKIDVISRFLRRPVFVKTYKKEKSKEKKIFWRTYRKIPQISPGIYIFQRPFLRGLHSEGLIYGGKFAFQNRLGKAYIWKQIYRFCFVLLCIWGQFSKYKPSGGLYLEGRFNGGFFALPIWVLILEALIFGILRCFLYTRTALQVAEPCGASKHPCPSCSKVG